MERHAANDILAVYLQGEGDFAHVGDLVRCEAGLTTFHVSEDYVSDTSRPILSSSLVRPGDHEATEHMLRASVHLKGGRRLPPWFENLLPEGTLREHHERHGKLHDFDLLRLVGCDLPGAVVVSNPSTGTPDVAPDRLRFSLAGVQNKLSVLRTPDGFEFLDGGQGGDTILKFQSSKHANLPEIEYSSMILAAAVGIDTAHVELVDPETLRGVSEDLLSAPGAVLAVDRFDRTPDGDRIHVEDFNQILGAPTDRKYTSASEEIVLKLAGLFGHGDRCFLQACRRVAVNILVGNTDAHLKNWAIWYPERNKGRLSPAYDIVAGAVYDHSNQMALRFRRTRDASIIDTSRFERAALFAGYSHLAVRDEIGAVVEQAADTWGSMMRGLPMPDCHAEWLLQRAQRLALTEEFGCWFEGQTAHDAAFC